MQIIFTPQLLLIEPGAKELHRARPLVVPIRDEQTAALPMCLCPLQIESKLVEAGGPKNVLHLAAR